MQRVDHVVGLVFRFFLTRDFDLHYLVTIADISLAMQSSVYNCMHLYAFVFTAYRLITIITFSEIYLETFNPA